MASAISATNCQSVKSPASGSRRSRRTVTPPLEPVADASSRLTGTFQWTTSPSTDTTIRVAVPT